MHRVLKLKLWIYYAVTASFRMVVWAILCKMYSIYGDIYCISSANCMWPQDQNSSMKYFAYHSMRKLWQLLKISWVSIPYKYWVTVANDKLVSSPHVFHKDVRGQGHGYIIGNRGPQVGYCEICEVYCHIKSTQHDTLSGEFSEVNISKIHFHVKCTRPRTCTYRVTVWVWL